MVEVLHRDVVPEAPEEIRQSNSDDDQPDDLVDILRRVEHIHLLLATGVLQDDLQKVVELRNIQDLDELGESHDSEQLQEAQRVLAAGPEDRCERKDRKKIDEEPGSGRLSGWSW